MDDRVVPGSAIVRLYARQARCLARDRLSLPASRMRMRSGRRSFRRGRFGASGRWSLRRLQGPPVLPECFDGDFLPLGFDLNPWHSGKRTRHDRDKVAVARIM